MTTSKRAKKKRAKKTQKGVHLHPIGLAVLNLRTGEVTPAHPAIVRALRLSTKQKR